MKRFLPAILALFILSGTAEAAHITGGEMYYTYLGQTGANYDYRVTVKLFKDCNCTNCANLDAQIGMAAFDKSTGTMVWSNGSVALAQIVTLSLNSPDPCISNPPVVCYQVGYYVVDISLPASVNGYIVSFQRCCRISGISNLTGSGGVGATYSVEIPGTSLLATAPQNNSARFVGSDTVIVCAGNPFTYSFAAVDADGDQLSYSFCTAYLGGGQTGVPPAQNSPIPFPPAPPPYISVPYATPQYSASAPLGSGVLINPTTGLISGIAPASGIYVVTVCVTETRNGIVIATQRKDLQIKVGDCQLATPLLNPRPTTCDDFTLSFQNDDPNPSPLINSYFWDFGVLTALDDTSNLPNPTFTYPDTGVYVVKLITNKNQTCSDSATVVVRIYPGFFPGFIFSGACYQNPFRFTDTTNTRYGVVDSWRWDFGDLTTLGDTSRIRNPQYTYPSAGSKDVQLIVTNSKGCIDTALVTIDVLEKPPLSLAFRDTLICGNDPLQLNATGTGTFNWTSTPVSPISNPASPTPTVSPTVNTWFFVNLDDAGCINRDSLQVRVVATVTLQARPDTTICLGDPVQLNALSDGVSYNWTASPSATFSNPAIINPVATSNNPFTTYTVVATIGSCSATDFVNVTAIPYPGSDAGPDKQLCYNTAGQLNAGIAGSSFIWSPVSYMNNPNVLNPIVTPPRTTQYILSVYDTLGCPKPDRDTVVVIVQPRIRAFAGNDTTVVVGQPLLFNGTGGVSYLWSPGTGLTSTTIHNPIGVYGPNIDSVEYKLIVRDSVGCSDSAYVTVYVYKTNPYVFVPTAFTPNNDGLNDVIRPIAVGIRRILYFSVYNRWGERVFITTHNKHGWDGIHNGKPQASGVYVWMLSAEDYLGRPLFLKGTVTLIR
ncbi:MAG: T9SS type B sorting domain-containing protein [Bacteroidetes bacterium]|nr:T9SS type B sorting domain-containing protein [Bacteroidota bacterium]